MSETAGRAITAAHMVCKLRHSTRDPFYNEELAVAEVRYIPVIYARVADGCLKRAFPGEFCSFTESSASSMAAWTFRLFDVGYLVPAAVAAVQLFAEQDRRSTHG
jgi:hypothetical protein